MEKEVSDELSAQPLSTLYAMQQEAKAEADSTKAWAAKIQAEIDSRLSPSAIAALTQQDKQHGTVNLPCQDGIIAKCVVDKKVEWDSDRLFAIAMTLPQEQARALMKFAVSVPEKNWDGIQHANPELAERLKAARTTKYGAPKVTLVKEP